MAQRWPWGSQIAVKKKKSCFKIKEPMPLLKKNINFNKKETESKMENPTHSFRETNLVLQRIQEPQINELELAKEK